VPSHRETRLLPYSAEQMFAVVADVEHYPDFVPGCAALQVRERTRDETGVEYVTAEMVVAYHGLRERYTSRVKLDPAQRTIEARPVAGPFQRLDTLWQFTPRGQGCEVSFAIDFAFRNPLLSAVAGIAFDGMVRRMAEAFFARARAVYGESHQLVEQAKSGLDRA
jgi:coenzyme Q-binding protein COQ10